MTRRFPLTRSSVFLTRSIFAIGISAVGLQLPLIRLSRLASPPPPLHPQLPAIIATIFAVGFLALLRFRLKALNGIPLVTDLPHLQEADPRHRDLQQPRREVSPDLLAECQRVRVAHNRRSWQAGVAVEQLGGILVAYF